MKWTWLLGALAVVIICLTLKRGKTASNLSRLDWFFAISIGLVFAIVSAFWLAEFHTQYPVLESDFFEYCTGVSAFEFDSPGVSSKRSTFPMMLPRLFYENLGLFDALAMGGIVSAAMLGAALYLWGRLIHGPMAGLAAGLLGMALGPLTLYTRTITSYPEMSLCFVLASTATAYGVVSRRTSAAAWAGAGIGLALLADVRGLFWAVPLSLTVLLAIALRGSFKKRFIRFACFVGVLGISFQMGKTAYVPNAIGFQQQVDVRPMFDRILNPESKVKPNYRYDNPWVWGRESPLHIIDASEFLLKQSTIAPPSLDELEQVGRSEEVRVGRKLAWNYLSCCFIAGLGAIWVCRRRSWRAIALIGTTCPFVVALYGNTSLLENHSRFYLQTLPGLAILLGVGFIGFIPKGKLKPRHALTATSALLAIVLGALPSPLSPKAGWQLRWQELPDHLYKVIEEYKSGERDRDPNFRHCRRALERLEVENKPLKVSFYSDKSPQ